MIEDGAERSTWRRHAEDEVARTLQRLPRALQERVQQLPVLYESVPAAELEAEGVESDTLGLFVGEAWVEEGATSAPLPAQIILYVDNLQDLAQGDLDVFLQEVRITYLHELGHYLGLDERGLLERGLE